MHDDDGDYVPTEKPLITILTPTYNRAHTLPTLKASLDSQSFGDFEWLIVDDGSTDGTPELMATWDVAGDARFRHIRTANGGKHRALNQGIPLARGEWTFVVDSDDWLPPGALGRISGAIPSAKADPLVGGIMGLRARPDGSIIGERLPRGIVSMDAASLTFQAGLRGDKAEIFKTEILKAFPFPEFERERFITECVVWFRIARAGWKLHLLDDPIYVCDYQEDGLSSRSLSLRIANPRGTLLFYGEELGLAYPARALFREAVNFGRFALHAGSPLREIRLLRGKARRLALLALPFGLLAYWLDLPRLGARR
jgi:glycosyltransferase involved in cell wall biosynthesis